jgi:hypothetical protein
MRIVIIHEMQRVVRYVLKSHVVSWAAIWCVSPVGGSQFNNHSSGWFCRIYARMTLACPLIVIIYREVQTPVEPSLFVIFGSSTQTGNHPHSSSPQTWNTANTMASDQKCHLYLLSFLYRGSDTDLRILLVSYFSCEVSKIYFVTVCPEYQESDMMEDRQFDTLCLWDVCVCVSLSL